MPISSNPILLCVGDIDMDIIVRVARPPGPDQKADGQRVAQTPGGMAANVAVGARRLGTSVRLAGAVGDDALGREALDALQTEGLDLSHVTIRQGVPTFFCMIMVDDGGEKSLVKVLSDAYLPRPEDLTPTTFSGVAHVHLTFTNPALARCAMFLARQAGAALSLDLEAADLPADPAPVVELLQAVDLLFINRDSRAEVERRIGSLPLRDNATVITTLGAEGARLEAGSIHHKVEGHRIRLTDTSGAGDAFAGAFLHAQLSGAEGADALRFANAAAALSTAAFGAQAGLPRRAEVETFLRAAGEAVHRA
jgi:ribokinase